MDFGIRSGTRTGDPNGGFSGGLAEDVFIAACLAEKDDKINARKTTTSEVEEIAAERYSVLKAESKRVDSCDAKEVLASHVYAKFAKNSGVSKAIAAQYLAERLLDKRQKEKLTSDQLRESLPKYLVAAIDYVTGNSGQEISASEKAAANERTNRFEPPAITDQDIYWAISLLGLPRNAFQGDDGNDPRQKVLKSMEPMDIAACPGSGKTTLLVAKLAILANGWRHATRGICVLSHTNAARHEIEVRLGTTNVGRRLLSYPHFIGTIHGFVNEFLALPWLRSKGISINMIDTDVCHERRWKALPSNIRAALETNHYTSSVLSIRNPDCSLGEVRWGKRGVLGQILPHTSL